MGSLNLFAVSCATVAFVIIAQLLARGVISVTLIGLFGRLLPAIPEARLLTATPSGN